ncbi:MAG: hypothetical protein A2Z18_07905 [Armatimonadetes bacterium RBG_16_58_9]|nr:MAG: hypothetical protein A2Z18_07905 [Armatimonadetes bacterium RBG_16_58_9]
MRLTMWLLCVLALVSGGLSPALGVTIEPGTYKMEWRIPAVDEDVSFGGWRFVSLAPISSVDAARFKGLSSSKGYLGIADNYTIILDEMNGTGAGCDTAYVFVGDPGAAERNVAGAVKINLEKRDGSLQSADSDAPMVDLTVGEEGSQITKRAALGLEVHDMSGDQPFAMLVVRGGWYGKLTTDTGDLDVQLIDANSNGVYGDKLSADINRSYPISGDVVLVGGPPARFEDYANMLFLGDVVSYGGKLYEMSVSETGEAVTVQSYKGPTGKLRVKAVDGRGKLTQCKLATVFGKSGRFSLAGTDLALPPGDYRCDMATIVPKQEGSEQERFGVVIHPNSAVKVAGGKTAVARIGGPMNVETAPGTDVITVSRGGTKMMQLEFTVGDDKLAGVMGNRMAWVNIRNRKGKLLSSEQSGFG